MPFRHRGISFFAPNDESRIAAAPGVFMDIRRRESRSAADLAYSVFASAVGASTTFATAISSPAAAEAASAMSAGATRRPFMKWLLQ